MIETPNSVEPQKSNTGLMIGIGAAVVVLLCCCVAVIVIAALTLMAPVVGKTFSTINNDIIMTSMPNLPATPDLSGIPTLSPDIIPQGGRGDEILRASAWANVLVAASLDGCSYNPKASATTIKVTQEPDSDGLWKEEWTLVCDDGSKKPYDLTFTPSAGGGTDIKVTSGK